MEDIHWSKTERRIAKAAFDFAVTNELAEILADFKRRAAAVTSHVQMWEIGEDLKQIRRDFDFKYDYRYSRMIFVLARLLREKRITEEDLQGLSLEKMETIRGIATFP